VSRGETESKVCGGLLLPLAGRIMKPLYLFCMIRKEELRIGNLIYFNPNGKRVIQKVKELRERDLICFHKNNPDQRLALFYDNCSTEPIPLTPEILEAAGFMYNKAINTWVHNEGQLKESEETKGTYYLAAQEYYYISKELTALHDLQNAFYYHTGTELEINLTKQPT
jgi:hypothetical protein